MKKTCDWKFLLFAAVNLGNFPFDVLSGIPFASFIFLTHLLIKDISVCTSAVFVFCFLFFQSKQLFIIVFWLFKSPAGLEGVIQGHNLQNNIKSCPVLNLTKYKFRFANIS